MNFHHIFLASPYSPTPSFMLKSYQHNQRGGLMKKWVMSAAAALSLVAAPMASSAATVTSGASYVPSKSYSYDTYDLEGTPKRLSNLKCSGPSSQRQCTTANYRGYTHLYYDKYLSLGVAYSDVFLTPAYKFPMTSGKTYKLVEYDMEGNAYPYRYEVQSVNTTKKVGNTTFKNVIRIKNQSGGYTFIAKNHGIILITLKKNGKQIPYYKVTKVKKR